MNTPTRPTRLEKYSPSLTLDSRGLADSRLALGLAGLGGAWGPVNVERSLETILHALERGIGAFDTAPSYQVAEKLLGQALNQWSGPQPIISTKVGRLPEKDPHEMRYDYSTQGIRDSVRRSLDILGVSKIDLLFLHEPHLVPLDERLRVVDELRQIQADGLTLRLGIAGGHGEDWNNLVESRTFDVAMLFRRIDPCMLNGIAEDIPRLRSAEMLTYGASPLHMGLLGSRYEEFVRERPSWAWGSQIERAIRLKIIADKNALTLPELAHRFTFSVAELDRVVIGASNQQELQSALDDFEAGPLPAELFAEVCRLNITP